MIIVKGKSEKSKWIYENFLDENTLVVDNYKTHFPCFKDGINILTITNLSYLSKILDEFKNEYTRKQYSKIVLYLNIEEIDLSKVIDFYRELNAINNSLELLITVQNESDEIQIEEYAIN